MRSFYETVNAAIRDIEEHGFDSLKRLEEWTRKIEEAARLTLTSPMELERELNRTYQKIYDRMVKTGYKTVAPGAPRFTIEQLKPTLRRELERRKMAAQALIKLNREQMVEVTSRRFAGWASSVPAGGSNVVATKDVSKNVRKALAQLPFEERRVMIDQGHKFLADLSDIIADDNDAIAARWLSEWRRPGYDYRPDHKERDGKVYAIRGNWALTQGLMKAGPAGYTDQITRPAEEVFCSCEYEYFYNIRDLPEDMLTAKGRKSLEKLKK